MGGEGDSHGNRQENEPREQAGKEMELAEVTSLSASSAVTMWERRLVGYILFQENLQQHLEITPVNRYNIRNTQEVSIYAD